MPQDLTRILIVEDSATDFTLIRKLLENVSHESYVVHRATGYSDALVMLASQTFDVCFVDYMLSDGNGLELIAEARAMESCPPMIMLTAHDARDVDVEATRAGADDYLCKASINPSVMERCIRYARERHRGMQSLKEAHEEIRRKDEALQHKQKLEAIGLLAGGVAHEFNNLLQAIQIYTQFAQQELEPSDRRYQDLTHVLKATDRAVKLTSQLLSFTRTDHFSPQPVEISDALGDVAAMLKPIIGATVELKIEQGKGLPPVMADPLGLQQMLVNLCVNARDAMPDGGVIHVTAEQVTVSAAECTRARIQEPGRYIVLSVADTGTGIESEAIDRVFDPFFTTKDVGDGTGLGLSMVHSFVQKHRGDVQVESELNQGTTFRILLPAAESVAGKTRRPASESFRGSREIILVADDEPLVRDAGVRILTKAGYRVLTAEDGQHAVELFKKHQHKISLALLDIVMPVMSGRRTLAEIRKIAPQTPVLFCSGYSPDRAPAAPQSDDEPPLISKPYDPQLLLEAVHSHLRRQDSPRQYSTTAVAEHDTAETEGVLEGWTQQRLRFRQDTDSVAPEQPASGSHISLRRDAPDTCLTE